MEIRIYLTCKCGARVEVSHFHMEVNADPCDICGIESDTELVVVGACSECLNPVGESLVVQNSRHYPSDGSERVVQIDLRDGVPTPKRRW